MRICIPGVDPGGPEGSAAKSFEDAEVFDFYETDRNGKFERYAQTRPCGCWGPDQAEAISRRGIEAVIVASISPSALLRFTSAGVRVFRADNPSVASLLNRFAKDGLDEIRIAHFAKSRKRRRGI